ncbi:hypothetical protein DVA67_027855 [Solirubrobacter sp. CPCC 204708]|nr:hypothetical protein [Solirubrobacter deserti]
MGKLRLARASWPPRERDDTFGSLVHVDAFQGGIATAIGDFEGAQVGHRRIQAGHRASRAIGREIVGSRRTYVACTDVRSGACAGCACAGTVTASGSRRAIASR